MADGTVREDVMRVDVKDDITTLTFDRPERRSAMDDRLISTLDAFFRKPSKGVSAVILRGEGGNLCSGLDLTEQEKRVLNNGVHHSRNWHRVFDLIESGGLPAISVLTGAVTGGRPEIATSTHTRIAEPNVRFRLPERRRYIFVCGGATVRVGRIPGAARTREMMLTSRSYRADDDGQLGLTHYSVDAGKRPALARGLARQIADNAPGLELPGDSGDFAHPGDMSRSEGLFTESLAAAVSQTSDGAREGMRTFLERTTRLRRTFQIRRRHCRDGTAVA